MKVLDERGAPWAVLPRDPAGRHITVLNRAGYQFIVLPRQTLYDGGLPAAPEGEYPDLSTVDEVRLLECVLALGVGGNE